MHCSRDVRSPQPRIKVNHQPNLELAAKAA
jgi:hypothetical protein